MAVITPEIIIEHLNVQNPEDKELITRAYEFAKRAHEGHVRYSGEPYLNHLAEVARMLAEIGMGAHTVSAGLLHDCI